MGKGLWLMVNLGAVCLLGPSLGWADPIGDRKTIIKAGFVYNFSKFVEWPNNNDLSRGSNEFTLCVMGKNAIENILSRLGEERKIKSRKVNIITGVELDNIENCQILYINESKLDLVDKVVQAARGLPILTISSGKEAAEKGIAITFVVVQNKMRFMVNKRSMEENRLKVSSEVLDLALKVFQ